MDDYCIKLNMDRELSISFVLRSLKDKWVACCIYYIKSSLERITIIWLPLFVILTMLFIIDCDVNNEIIWKYSWVDSFNTLIFVVSNNSLFNFRNDMIIKPPLFQMMLNSYCTKKCCWWFRKRNIIIIHCALCSDIKN